VRDFLLGPYGQISMALTYGLAIVFPIVGTFFLMFSLMEDSGYLPRLAVMLNRPFKALGLNGRAGPPPAPRPPPRAPGGPGGGPGPRSSSRQRRIRHLRAGHRRP